jgi:ribosomal-protein-alanine N-acetyltransferase
MQFTHLPQSEHPLVTLRAIEESDLAAWYGYLSVPAVFEHTSWNLASAQELAMYVWEQDAFTPSTLLRFAVALRTTNELVGTAGFHTVSPQNRSAELAYDLAPTVWGNGIATYIASLLVS